MQDNNQTTNSTATENKAIQWAKDHKTAIVLTTLGCAAVLTGGMLVAKNNYKIGHADGITEGFGSGYSAGMKEGLRRIQIPESSSDDAAFNQVASTVSGHARKLPTGFVRSVAKDQEIKSLGLDLPDDVTFVDAHSRVRSRPVAA
ncbi:hypothetical protein [Bifidobacterium callitrichidarum]|uniref:Uncharacterized protein n=1 Tax=Bifidobacterium callitrichidarum TaxID=2052941 RepID=A0A2U2NBX3_9BIFI|nr:hypothetical protein [Bifidobacterium callitrichidarum]PWG66645.1 hypothetical protein DF196_01720 [Bifidobacterium callitrichidarum]